MARRRLIWHIGLAHPARNPLGVHLEEVRAQLADDGVLVGASEAEARLMSAELVGDYQRRGLTKGEVGGTTQRVCERIWRHKGLALLSTPDVCAADKMSLRLALDALKGVEVHLVIDVPNLREQVYGAWLHELDCGAGTGWGKYSNRVLSADDDHRQRAAFAAGHDPGGVLKRWSQGMRQERIHVIFASNEKRPGAATWASFLEVAGLKAADYGAIAASSPGGSMAVAHGEQCVAPQGAQLLRQINKQADEPPSREDKRALLVGRVDPNQLPPLDSGLIHHAIAEWKEVVSGGDCQVVGKPKALSGAGGVELDPDAASALAVERLVEVLEQNHALRERLVDVTMRLERAEKKRRKLKERMGSSA